MEREKTKAQYEKPQVKDYGDLRELTATNLAGLQTDVPKGTPITSPFLS